MTKRGSGHLLTKLTKTARRPCALHCGFHTRTHSFFSHIVISNTQQNTFKCTLSVTLRPFKAYCTGPSLSPQPVIGERGVGTIAH
uniref:Uncharacterized protein n=1 Tax=Anguilla anguilla TaxID=7936 RepID=A0A0E9U5R6_ANGAN